MNSVKTVKSCFKIKTINNGKTQSDDLSYNVTFLNVTRFVILLYCCKCVFPLSAVSLKHDTNYISRLTRRVTPPSPPCVLRIALFWHCVLRTAIFWPHVLRTVLQQKKHILAVSIYIKKIKLQYGVCTCTLILENISFDVFVC